MDLRCNTINIQWFVNFCNLYLDQTDSEINIDIKISLANLRLVNGVSENNLPLTGNLWKQTPKKCNSRVVFLSDSHLKGCKRINNHLNDNFKKQLVGSKPNALGEQILDKLTVGRLMLL
jgi:hypothetical protein